MKPPDGQAEEKFRELLDLVARLRSPDGCPWDRSRNQGDIGHYLIEEAYEVLEALEGASPEGLKEELGDLLFQILFLARLAEEKGEFEIGAVLEGITEKMVRRHPHVFGDATAVSVGEVRDNWERIKRDVEHKKPRDVGLCEDLPPSLSTLAKAQLVTARASKVGFDWDNAAQVLAKLEEEIAEFRAALEAKNKEQMQEEAGDLIFTVVNLCRFARVDAEAALRSSLRKFADRFAHIEKALASQGKTTAKASLAEMDLLWDEAKKKGKTG